MINPYINPKHCLFNTEALKGPMIAYVEGLGKEPTKHAIYSKYDRW